MSTAASVTSVTIAPKDKEKEKEEYCPACYERHIKRVVVDDTEEDTKTELAAKSDAKHGHVVPVVRHFARLYKQLFCTAYDSTQSKYCVRCQQEFKRIRCPMPTCGKRHYRWRGFGTDAERLSHTFCSVACERNFEWAMQNKTLLNQTNYVWQRVFAHIYALQASKFIHGLKCDVCHKPTHSEYFPSSDIYRFTVKSTADKTRQSAVYCCGSICKLRHHNEVTIRQIREQSLTDQKSSTPTPFSSPVLTHSQSAAAAAAAAPQEPGPAFIHGTFLYHNPQSLPPSQPLPQTVMVRDFAIDPDEAEQQEHELDSELSSLQLSSDDSDYSSASSITPPPPPSLPPPMQVSASFPMMFTQPAPPPPPTLMPPLMYLPQPVHPQPMYWSTFQNLLINNNHSPPPPLPDGGGRTIMVRHLLHPLQPEQPKPITVPMMPLPPAPPLLIPQTYPDVECVPLGQELTEQQQQQHQQEEEPYDHKIKHKPLLRAKPTFSFKITTVATPGTSFS